MKSINHLLQRVYSIGIPEIVLSIFCAMLYLFNAVRYSLPMGYAGLYTLLSERLAANNFVPPMSVPFYKVGGIPFAYPPVGFYLAALFLKIPGTQIFTYLRFAPPVFTLLFLVADYLFIWKLTTSRIKALLGVGMTAASSMTLSYNLAADGMVRALALLLATIGLIFVWSAFTGTNNKKPFLSAIWAGIFLGLTTMTHLSYAVFFALGVVAFALWKSEQSWRQRAILTGIMFIGGFLISSPWWGMILVRYGSQTLLFALQSHDNMGIIRYIFHHGWSALYNVVKTVLTIANNWKPLTLVGIELIGLIYLISRRRWLLFGWFAAVFLFIGEGDRFLVILSCIAAAEALGDLATFIVQQDTSQRSTNLLAYSTALSLLLIYNFFPTLTMVYTTSPDLTKHVMDLASWFHQYTQPNENYLFLVNDNPLGEWLPYLTERTTLVGNWGREWTGDYYRQVDLLNQIQTCSSSQSFVCYQGVIQQIDLPVSYLVSPTYLVTLNEEIYASPDWIQVYTNSKFDVFKRK